MHLIAVYVFWSTLLLYGVTLATASYVGVYLSYIAIPLIVLSGIVILLTKPKEKSRNIAGATVTTIKGVLGATNHILAETNSVLDDFNRSLESRNKKNELIRIRTTDLKNEVNALKLNKSKSEIQIKYAKNDIEASRNHALIITLNEDISILENKIKDVEKQCELEALQAID